MTMGVSECQADLFRGTGFVGDRVEPGSVFALLFGEGDRLFPDSMFADLFSGRGRRSVAPRTVATVMVLQRWFGLSDREAVAAFEFDVRWRYACGGLALDSGGFCHTVLVGMRARLAASQSPRRIFDVVLDAARAAGAVSPRRVLDSAPIYDAVATQDTVTMLRSAIRQTLAAADAAGFGPRLRAVLRRDDDYASGGKAVCDWEDPAAREALVAELAEDASAVLEAMRGRALGADAADAAELLAAVSGQDLEAGPDNKMRIARRVAEDRVISTTDPDARHGRKSTAGGFDGYKGHIAVDPDSELITDTAVTAGNAADASAAAALIKDLTNNHTTGDTTGTGSTDSTGTGSTDSTGTGSTDSTGTGGPDSGGTGGGGVCGGGRGCVCGPSGRVWRQRLWQRGVPAVPARRAHQLEVPHPEARGARRALQQGPLRRRCARRRGHLPRGGPRGDPPRPRRRRHRPLRRGLRRLRAAPAVHRGQRRQNHPRLQTRSRPRRCPRPPKGPGLEARLPRHAPQSRAQARPPQTPLARRPKSPRAGPAQSRRRLQPAGRRRQPGAPRRARPALPAPEMGPRLTTTSPQPPEPLR